MSGDRRNPNNTQQWGPQSNGQYGQNGSYYAAQYDLQGNDGYEYPPQSNIEALTNSFDGLSTGATGYSYNQGAARIGQSGLPTGSSSYVYTAEPQYTNATHVGQQGDGGGLGGGAFPSVLNNQGASHLGAVAAADSSLEADKGKGIQTHDPYDGMSSGGEYGGFGAAPIARYPTTNNLVPYYTTGSNAFPTDDSKTDQHDYQVEQALNASRTHHFGNMRPGETSNSTTHYASGHYIPTYRQTSNYGELDTTPRTAPAQLPPIGGVILQYNDAETQNQNYSLTNPSTTGIDQQRLEPQDHRFVVHHSNAFIPGHVLKVWWSEPRGQTRPHSKAPTGHQTVRHSTGSFHVGYRRFLIVRTDDGGLSICVPILTYEMRACCKPGVHPSKHGIIYSADSRPRSKPREPRLGFKPVALRIYAEGETLVEESRVNYSKLVTIEHNTKVFFIGEVPEEDFRTVEEAVDKCWLEGSNSNHRRRRR